MTDENDSEELEDRLVEILHESGFTVVPMQTVIDALAEMENYLKEQAGITQEELEVFLHKIENLIGKEESFKLDLDEILSWIKTFQSF